MDESGDDLNPVSCFDFGRLSWVGVDGGLTGSDDSFPVCSGKDRAGWWFCECIMSNRMFISLLPLVFCALDAQLKTFNVMWT